MNGPIQLRSLRALVWRYPLKTPVGSMHGSYQMVTAEGEAFDAVITPFTLAVPHSLN